MLDILTLLFYGTRMAIFKEPLVFSYYLIILLFFFFLLLVNGSIILAFKRFNEHVDSYRQNKETGKSGDMKSSSLQKNTTVVTFLATQKNKIILALFIVGSTS